MESQNENKRFQKSYFDVLGLCCSSEVPLIENILKPRDGVKEVSVIIATRTVIVVHDALLISPSQIEKALNEARLEANVRVYGQKSFKKKWPSPYALACGALLLFSLLKYVYRPFGWLALAAVAIGIVPICLKAITSIRNFRLDINILAIIAVIGTIAMRDYLEAGTIVFLFTIAEWLESRASHKANAVMTSLMNMVPQKAVIADTGEVVDADKVALSTVVAVKAGEVIPIDGVVMEGTCEVDEKTLTGESFPVTKQKEAIVWAGTINLNGYISVRTTALAQDCAVAKMAKLVEEAQNSKSNTQRFIDKCAKFYTPAVMIISISVAVVPVALKAENLRKWFHLALVILVSACPCGLILSTPVATFCALTKAAKSGLLIKGGEYLESLSKIKIVAFDKTGTITRGEITITDFVSLHDDISMDDLLYWVSSIESKSSHPMAAALVEHAKSLSIEAKPENVEDFENFPGQGIHGRIEGRDVYIGNKKISARASCETVPTLEGYAKAGKSVGYIFCNGRPAGIFSLSDACRSGVVEAIKELKALGIRTAMLTGDSHAAATYAHEQTGNSIEAIHAELLPEDKARIIKQFKTEGRTAMVGDGMNDAAALATADIGISMGISGSALASESGNVVLLSNDMRKIPKAVRLARRAQTKVVQNIVLSIVTKVAIIALAIAGHPLVWAAVLADTGTCLLVIINSMFLLKESNHHSGKCRKSSSSSHAHKHGCKDGHGKSPSIKGQKCCSNKKVQHACEVTICQTKTSNSASCCENKGGSYFTDVSAKTQHCHRRICGAVNHDSESRDSHCHVRSTSRTRLGSCEEVDHHTNHSSNHFHRSVSPVTESLNLASKPQDHSICCVQHHVGHELPEKRAELACTHQHPDEHTCPQEHDKSLVGINGIAETVNLANKAHCHSICSGKNHVAAATPKKTVERACSHQHQDGFTHSIKHEKMCDIVAETVNLASTAQGHSICCDENHVATGAPHKKAELACTHQHEDGLACSKIHEKGHTSVYGVAETVNLARKAQGHSICCDQNHATTELRKPKAKAACGHHHEDGYTHSIEHEKCHTSIDMSQADGDHEESQEILPVSTAMKAGITGGCCRVSHERDLFPGSAVASACLSLEKRDGSCCSKTYMQQCCSSMHGHLGAVLSEVIIEN